MTSETPHSSKKTGLIQKILMGLGVLLLVLMIAIAAIMVLVPDSGRPDGFNSATEKDRVWAAYKCKYFQDVDAGFTAIGITHSILNDDVPRDEVPEAQRYQKKLAKAGDVGDVIELEPGTNMCTGWLWTWYQRQEGYMKDYEAFTLETARNEGVVRE
ncbi:hypothetical protein CPHO_08555 [Corynebacterium phocae]|uniref:Uncharacterized protein n=1 Tax=Corynebacterium phocae TaxID=161895 RepID=A0A1L7D473_9CORY|nr:hypothetical protein [Corynebacterium phocae]APT92928.1 hypothetical protein CPHO_08555 [Corynebacterium phocae]KAA8723260.1 hypothetical protein F4V58_08060 [Corynebacterium phocae]